MTRTLNRTVPHAKANEIEPATSRSAFSQFADTIRENPRTAIAAGAAVVAGATAAAVIGTRGRKTPVRRKKSA